MKSSRAGTRPAVVAIHQPNFLPWLGYFDKLVIADVFVILDDVQFPKKSGTWMNRTKLVVGGAEKWATAPIDRSYHGTRTVAEMRFGGGPWRSKLLRTIEQSYRRAPHFDDGMPLVETVLSTETESILEFNLRGVREVAAALGLDREKMVLASTLRCEATATERLVELTKAVGGGVYLAGGGAGGYQDDDLFERAGVSLRYQGFKPPAYPQLAEKPIRGVSVVDAIMNLGAQGTRELLS